MRTFIASTHGEALALVAMSSINASPCIATTLRGLIYRVRSEFHQPLPRPESMRGIWLCSCLGEEFWLLPPQPADHHGHEPVELQHPFRPDVRITRDRLRVEGAVLDRRMGAFLRLRGRRKVVGWPYLLDEVVIVGEAVDLPDSDEADTDPRGRTLSYQESRDLMASSLVQVLCNSGPVPEMINEAPSTQRHRIRREEVQHG